MTAQQYKRVTRTILVPCPQCFNSVFARPSCTHCDGKGEVSRTINELVPVVGDEDSEAMLMNAGSIE